MSTPTLLAAVIIPTHNRGDVALNAIEALGRQDCLPGSFEVIVVPNGCTDDTLERLRTLQTSFALTIVPVREAGASTARNTGAAHARAPLAIFMDDDVTPDPWFVTEHLDAHRCTLPSAAADSFPVVVGYLRAPLQPEADRFAITLRAWWEAMFDRMRQPGHRFDYKDLLSGNFSIDRARFIEHGGFDARLRCHEDYELGYRLIRSGARLRFAERASGLHTDVTRLQRACWRKREEGIADVELARMHPEIRAILPMARRRTPNQHAIRTLAFQFPGLGDRLARLMERALRVFETTGAIQSWYRAMDGLLGYWYERGLADALGSRAALDILLAGAPTDAPDRADPLDLDLAPGLDTALNLVDRVRPGALNMRVGTVAVGEIPWRPGAERLAARHVAAALVTQFHKPYVEALHAAGELDLVTVDAETEAPSR